MPFKTFLLCCVDRSVNGSGEIDKDKDKEVNLLKKFLLFKQEPIFHVSVRLAALSPSMKVESVSKWSTHPFLPLLDNIARVGRSELSLANIAILHTGHVEPLVPFGRSPLSWPHTTIVTTLWASHSLSLIHISEPTRPY